MIDKEGCIQILALCINCLSYCLNTPHLTPDGSRIIYSVRRDQPFRMVNADGSGAAQLPVFTGSLAPAAQRVIAANGTLVFTSSAPSGPTFAASATDVYTIGLNGSGLRNLTNFGPNSAIFAANAVISMTGDVVAFESNYGDTSGQVQIWMIRTGATGLRKLSTGAGPASSPSISADGAVVAFAQEGQIWITRTDGASSQKLTSFRISVGQDPVISGDGSRVAFSLGPREGQRGAIHTVSLPQDFLLGGFGPHPVYAPRWMNRDGVTGAAIGSLMTAYGANLASDVITIADGPPLSTALDGVSLLVNGQPAPLLAVTPWQVNAQLPPETPLGTARIQFRFANGDTTPPINVEVKSVSPELFSYLSAGAQPGTVYQQAAA